MSMTVTLLCGMQYSAAMVAESLVAASAAEEHEVTQSGSWSVLTGRDALSRPFLRRVILIRPAMANT